MLRAAVVSVFCASDDPINEAEAGGTEERPRWGLKLRASLQRVVLRYRAQRRGPGRAKRNEAAMLGPAGMEYYATNADGSLGQAFLDCPAEIAGFGEGMRRHADGVVEVDVLCLPLMRKRGKIICLLLVPHGQGAGVYSRVGLGLIRSNFWWGSEEVVECEIV